MKRNKRELEVNFCTSMYNTNAYHLCNKKYVSTETVYYKETESEIKKLMKSSTRILSKRFQALLVFKRYEKIGISKRQVADEIGVNILKVINYWVLARFFLPILFKYCKI